MDDAPFTRGAARRPIQISADPLLQWSTGLPTKERRIYAGWLAEVGKHDDFDGAMDAAGFEQVTIKHGSGAFVTHWAIETANLFLLADGVQSIGEMKHTNERYGIAFGWREREGSRQQSVLRARAHLRELVELGFNLPVLISTKSTLTGDLITAFMAQYEVLEAINAFRKLDKKGALDLPLYACSLPIGPGEEVSRGSGGQTKEITPPVAKIPRPITREYLAAHWIKREWVAGIERQIDDTVRWSNVFSDSIAGNTWPREASED